MKKGKTDSRSIIFYDGECGLCNKSVRRVWKNDQEGVFHFASLQSDFAHKFLSTHHQLTEVSLNTIYVHHEDHLYEKSQAVVKIGEHVNDRLIKVASWLMRNCPSQQLSDNLYDMIAANRHKLSKTEDVCEVPPADVQKRFLD